MKSPIPTTSAVSAAWRQGKRLTGQTLDHRASAIRAHRDPNDHDEPEDANRDLGPVDVPERGLRGPKNIPLVA